MTRRQSLGQHFLISQSVARTIAAAADITKDDIVLEIGNRKGNITSIFVQRCKKSHFL